mmetsp:Transcript_22634/g.27999  ORF Transcript_22634/g.27999 Transcript_22634/m.27999 type:complete len:369 (-) Transcript_22634:191-1297(-)|eukprot:CAMPEP_0170461642 /NCGR_PEP_ID=MMETSP0123-20130129/7463_1 /TAXON_ID=182087 /ORGANISM="Favella ehrenbergii, Strain Fehren 1" /LENGTH=368 /DNA_ID=CAMNT_0010726697 /DNA_START=201 /DNA_END=1307 /DNA_ORIENTATION=+
MDSSPCLRRLGCVASQAAVFLPLASLSSVVVVSASFERLVSFAALRGFPRAATAAAHISARPHSHDDLVSVDAVNALVRQNFDASQARLVLDLHVFARASHRRQAAPAAHSVLPSNDGVSDDRVGLKSGLVENSGIFDAHTRANLAASADDDVGSELRRRVNLGRLVDDDAAGTDKGAALFGEGANIHALAANVVGGLPDVHPVAGQLHLVELLLRGHRWENFPLDRCRAILDSVDYVQVEDVKARIDLVADIDLGLLDEALDLAVFLGDDDAVACGVFHLGNDDGALVPVALMESHQLVERVLADHIRVEHEEEATLVVAPEDALGELDGASSAQRLVLERDRDLNAILALVVGDGRHHDIGLVVYG